MKTPACASVLFAFAIAGCNRTAGNHRTSVSPITARTVESSSSRPGRLPLRL